MNRRIKVLRWTYVVILLLVAGYVGALSFGFLGKQTAAVSGGRSKKIELYTLKGTVYDRHLTPITNAKTSYYLLVDPRNFVSADKDILTELCGIEDKVLEKKLSKESIFILQSRVKPPALKGVYVFEGVGRYQDVAEHIVGYVDGEMRGVTGLEKSYDSALSYFGGQKNVTFATDGRSNPMTGLGLTVSGEDTGYKNGVVTTLDIDLQKELEAVMAQYIVKGAAVVLDTDSGEILACASLPDYDAERVEQYLEAIDGQLINRALSPQTVGSVFKLVVAAAALEEGIGAFDALCSGGTVVGDLEFTCPKEGGHGEMDLESAFAQSCNVYFISLAQMLGTDKVMDMAKRLGFGESMEIADGLYASGGMLPDVTGHSAKQLANISIGQGDVMASPLQIARLMAVCAEGYLLRPSCFQGFYVDGILRSEKWLDYKTRVLSDEVVEELRRICIATVESGTGSAACPEEGGAGGKTSSAQTGQYDSDGKEILNTYFAGFYPAEEPRYAIAVFAENGVSGGATCAPVFKAVCDYLRKY
ncbi:MAG: penicillin-binding protein 2 [Clostridia bacterium]|nr:penicillin-binding protein 2 [Clostridia bacterium]